MVLYNPGFLAIGLIAILATACGHAVPVFEGRSQSSLPSKLDSELLHHLEGLSNRGHLDERLSVLIRTSSEINPDQEMLLKSRGVIIRSKLGVILSAIIPAKSVQDAALLQFVLRSEISKKLKER